MTGGLMLIKNKTDDHQYDVSVSFDGFVTVLARNADEAREKVLRIKPEDLSARASGSWEVGFADEK